MSDFEPVLRLQAKPIQISKLRERKMQEFIDDLLATNRARDGYGLAAPQVSRSIQLFVMDTDEGERVVVNPRVLAASTLKEQGPEGCFSVPDPSGGSYVGMVERPIAVVAEYHDRQGQRVREELYEMEARTYLHELDHLHGILLVDHWKESGVEVIEEAEYLDRDGQLRENTLTEAESETLDPDDLEWEPYIVMSPAQRRLSEQQTS